MTCTATRHQPVAIVATFLVDSTQKNVLMEMKPFGTTDLATSQQKPCSSHRPWPFSSSLPCLCCCSHGSDLFVLEQPRTMTSLTCLACADGVCPASSCCSRQGGTRHVCTLGKGLQVLDAGLWSALGSQQHHCALTRRHKTCMCAC